VEKQEQAGMPKYRATPNYTAWIKDDKFILQVAIPGVSRDSIKMKALQDFFMLEAERDNILYALELDLNFRIDTENVSTSFDEGLLRVEFSLVDPLKEAYTVLQPEKNMSEMVNDSTFRTYPEIRRYVNYAQKDVQVEISLPGVRKEDILLQALPDWFHLSAARQGDNLLYTANFNWGVEVNYDQVTADYNNGLLKIWAPIRDPLERAQEVEL
jgi:HSP20 family molecular chaperone IbpA